MSHEAVKWAMDDAPMLLTDKGKPDTTARGVLQALAEHAHKDGSGAHPSVLRLQYRTGYDRRTVQRALRRNEAGNLIKATGETNGRTIWKLALHLKRPESDWADLERLEDEERASAAERKRRSRAKAVTHSPSVTVTHSPSVTDGGVTHSASVSHALEMRDVTHSASGRHALNAALTISQPSVQPPTTTGADVGGEGADPRSLTANAPIDDDGFTLTDSMRRWALTTFGPAIDIDHETALFLDHYRATGARRTNWAAEWQKWIRRQAKWTAERAARPGSNVVHLPAGRTLTGTDARVAGWAALTAELEAKENQQR
ncbi:helix-turn-helix domain-containing protein [Streptomyces sp. NBC_01754]|uniref:helix-turn-helix domain-containing protein n=1 Tax=Streptomyces sp. NBC_01754 TaxID=2975930 RepID=UPI002DD7EF2F|nr:helix-turn-helix domain-containing protein [Streptomyces sp. NBC_01754]WSC95252.1 helix-turn-helix domain-containing protein [Streptomyces sp. NBC_01754]